MAWYDAHFSRRPTKCLHLRLFDARSRLANRRESPGKSQPKQFNRIEFQCLFNGNPENARDGNVGRRGFGYNSYECW